MNHWTIRVPMEEEIKACLFSLGSDKSLRLDGFTIEFYKRHWETVENDIVIMVCGYFEGRGNLSDINSHS